jgi:hypothetical protein
MFFYYLQNFFGKISAQFATWALTAYGYGDLFAWIGDACVAISDFFAQVSGFFYDAWSWWDNLTDTIARFITQSWLYDFMSDPLAKINQLWTWFLDRWSNVEVIILGWWEGTKTLVNDFIAALIAEATAWITERLDELGVVKVAWDNFWTITWPVLQDNLSPDAIWRSILYRLEEWGIGKDQAMSDGMDAKINPLIAEVEHHTTWLDTIKELFEDPEEWLVKKIEAMLERFW